MTLLDAAPNSYEPSHERRQTGRQRGESSARETPLRLLYGVHGYSRGHATRAAAVLSELTRDHEVLILAGPDAYDFLKGTFDVVPIPSLRFIYGDQGRISPKATLSNNLPLVADLFLHGRRSREIAARVKAFDPQVAICDAEPWTHRTAARLGIPRVSFDHFGIMVYCDVPLAVGDRMKSLFDRLAYRLLMGRPERVLVSSFYSAPPKSPKVRVIGPLLGEEVHAIPRTRRDHILVYLNNGQHQLTPRLEGVLRSSGLPMIVYGANREGRDENLDFRPPSRRGFLEDLASARAIVSTAGNQLVGEALYFRRPLLVMPESTVEQRMNAAAVARLGVGEAMDFSELTTESLARFVERIPTYEAAARAHAVDGRQEALTLLSRWIEELDLGRRRLPGRMGTGAGRRATV